VGASSGAADSDGAGRLRGADGVDGVQARGLEGGVDAGAEAGADGEAGGQEEPGGRDAGRGTPLDRTAPDAYAARMASTGCRREALRVA
jgi:hypothetical protein